MHKETPKGLKRCYRCRNIALKKATTVKESFGGICINGIYEYCRPVIIKETTVAVIFIGNIYCRNQKIKNTEKSLIKTLQHDFTKEDCEKTADIIESYISFLAREYPTNKTVSFNPLIENIKNYIEENLSFNFSISTLAEIFNYNQKYLGRIFKKHMKLSIVEYTNLRRIEKVIPLIESSNISITELALKSGFNNVTYFNRVFKNVTGKTPSEIRNKK